MSQENRDRPSDYFADWKEREALAEGMIPMVGKLSREKSVKCYIYGHSLVNQSVLQIMKIHRYVRQVEKNELSEFETNPILQNMIDLDLGPAHIDIGRLAVNYFDKAVADGVSVGDYVQTALNELIGMQNKPVDKPVDVVLYGFGRIGRLMARILIEKADGGDCLRLRAIVVRPSSSPNDLSKRASLLRRDSVHGAFEGTIRVDEERQSLVANGNEVKVIYASSPDKIDYTRLIPQL